MIPTSGHRLGAVTEFDAARGIGSVRDDDGTVLAFHCTQIADGTRTIPVGTRIRYTLTPGALGTWEACAIESTGAGDPASPQLASEERAAR